MDDATFELLKKIDEGFEEGSGPYSLEDLDEIAPTKVRGTALISVGNEGFNLRMAVMKAVEAEKARRAKVAEAEFSCPAMLGVFDL